MGAPGIRRDAAGLESLSRVCPTLSTALRAPPRALACWAERTGACKDGEACGRQGQRNPALSSRVRGLRGPTEPGSSSAGRAPALPSSSIFLAEPGQAGKGLLESLGCGRRGSTEPRAAQQGHCEPPPSAQGEPQRLPAACHQTWSRGATRRRWSKCPAAPQADGLGGVTAPSRLPDPPKAPAAPSTPREGAGELQPSQGPAEPPRVGRSRGRGRQGKASIWERGAARNKQRGWSPARGTYPSPLQPGSCCCT